MPNQESTAIKDLIDLVQGRKLERDSENPVPELFAAPRPIAPAPARVASGTKPPPTGMAMARPADPPVAPQPAVQAQGTPQPRAAHKPNKKVYRIPAVEHDDEQTELWSSPAADIDTAPAVPSIAPHAATVIAAPHAPSVPAILRGPVGATPGPSVPVQSGPGVPGRHENEVDRAAAAREAQIAHDRAIVARALAARQAAQSHDMPGHSRARPAVHPSHSRLMAAALDPVPSFRIPVAPPAPAKPASPASWLIAREVMTSWGTLALIAAIALGIGVYVAIATRKAETTVAAPTERDRAIAIMNGTAQPEPEHTIVKAPRPSETAPVTTPRPAPFDSVETREPSKPTSEPIVEPTEPSKPTSEPIVEPTTEPIPDDAGKLVADDQIDADAIELEPSDGARPKRAARASRAARAKALKDKRRGSDPVAAILDEKPTRAEPARAGDDPVLAILNEKPKKSSLVKAAEAKERARVAAEAEAAAQKKLDKKKVKEPTGAATEIAAPKGALAAKGTGKVSITSDVAAMIFLDGRPTGKTAPTAFVVPAGDHQITLLDPKTKKAKTASVQIAANKSVSVRKDFN